MNKFSHLAALLPILLLIMSCGSFRVRRTEAVLSDVESYIDVRPDSALSVLQGIDSTCLKSRNLKARYSLLLVMTLDKNYKDITSPGLLDPAVKWYERHGSADERMKTLFYLGCIKQEEGELNAAVSVYSQAEKYVNQANDSYAAALLYEAIASIYNSVYNVSKEQEYVEKALDVLKKADDSRYGSFLGNLARIYHSRQEWFVADSLYREAISCSDDYPKALSNYLSNYARMKVLQPEKDPAGTLDLLNRKRQISGGGLSPKEAGAYAYALELIGDHKTADALVNQLLSLSDSSRIDVLPWLSRIAEARDDYSLAFSYQAEAYKLESEVVKEALTDSVNQSLKEDAESRAQQAEVRKRQVFLFGGLIVMSLLSLLLLAMLRQHRIREERDCLISIRERLSAELDESEHRAESLEVSVGEHERALKEMQEIDCERIAAIEQKVALEREEYSRERLIRLRQLGGLRSALWWHEKGYMKESETLRKIRKEIQYVFQLDNDGRVLIRRLDKELDGAVSRLREQLHLRGNPKEVLFLCCCILDLEPEMIAEIIGTSKANVYEKRSRLRAKIRSLEDPLLYCLVEKTNKLE